jgi:tetraacyldisaccharide 4'-kinase
LIRLLKETYQIATLSRGYKRTTVGFQLANNMSSVETIGDEPYQFYNKFNDIIVGVDSNRQRGISRLQILKNPDIILLDDAFQHRKVNAGLNILLTSYSKLYIDDICLPTGDLREPRTGSNRADIIVITKCPNSISIQERNNIVNRLKLKQNQEAFFSTIEYSSVLYSNDDNINVSELKKANFTLVTGIANSLPLVNHLEKQNFKFEHFKFSDHHKYSDTDIEMLGQKKLVITTEKDFTKLSNRMSRKEVYFLPIETKILEHEKFDNLILDFCSK